MTDKASSKEKIKMYKEHISTLEVEKSQLEIALTSTTCSDYNKAKIQQRIFDLKVTIEGHEAFIREYQSRINPTTYRKTL